MALSRPRHGKALLAGDWHGSTGQAMYAINEAVKQDLDTIIQLGDFGYWGHIGHGDSFLTRIQRAAEAAGVHIYWIDGNHESFKKLYEIPLDENGLRPISPNITHLPRNTRWTWDGITFLALGGAQSIDEGFRTEGKDYFSEERITPQEAQTAIDGGHAIVMFTHDAPNTMPNPVTESPLGQHQAEGYYGRKFFIKCRTHQSLLAEVTNAVRPDFLFHGHYHLSQTRMYSHLPHEGKFSVGVTLDQGTAAGNPANLHILDLKDVKRYTDEKN